MEHQEYHRQVAYIILDSYAKIIMEECQNGFDEKTRQQLHEVVNGTEQAKEETKKVVFDWSITRNFLKMGLMKDAGNPEQKEIIIWWTAR